MFKGLSKALDEFQNAFGCIPKAFKRQVKTCLKAGKRAYKARLPLPANLESKAIWQFLICFEARETEGIGLHPVFVLMKPGGPGDA